MGTVTKIFRKSAVHSVKGIDIYLEYISGEYISKPCFIAYFQSAHLLSKIKITASKKSLWLCSILFPVYF